MEVKEISLKDLELDEMNVRQYPYPQAELEDSIEKHGILDPLLVRPNDHEGYTIVCGSMRFKAAEAVGLKMVPCVIRELTDEEALVLSLTENVQRANLTLDEEADAVAKLYEILGKSQTRTADELGKTRRWVYERLTSKGIIDVFKKERAHGHAASIPRDAKKVSDIGSVAKSLFPEEEDKQAELYDTLKDKDRKQVKRASTYLRAKAEEEPEVFDDRPIQEVVEDAFKVVNIDVSLTFSSKTSKAIMKVAEEREISWEDVVEIAVEQWLKDGGYLD